MAHARGHDLDQHFASLGAFKIDFDDLKRLLGGERNGGAGLHQVILPEKSMRRIRNGGFGFNRLREALS